MLPLRSHRTEQANEPLIDFFVGTELEVSEIADLGSTLKTYGADLKAMHAAKRAVSLKICAEEIAKKAKQLNALASHLADVSARHLNRNPKNGSSS